jgi:hypothetical protein
MRNTNYKWSHSAKLKQAYIQSILKKFVARGIYKTNFA